MDVFDKAGKAVGDAIAKAKERERIRLEDRLKQIDRIDECARSLVETGKHRPGYSWPSRLTSLGLEAVSAAAMVGDDELATAVDALVAIRVTTGTPAPVDQLDGAYRAMLKRLAIVRRETLADD